MVRPTKALDQVVRNRIAPALEDLGFTRKGRRFTFERPDGARAFAVVSPFTLGQKDAEFHVEFSVQPKIWRDFVTARDLGPDGGLWSGRVLVPGATGPMRDHWSFDLGDVATGATLTAEVAKLAETAVGLLEPVALLALIRSNPYLPFLGTRREVAVAALLAASEGPSPELEDTLTRFDQDPDWQDFNPAFTAFVRAWRAGRP